MARDMRKWAFLVSHCMIAVAVSAATLPIQYVSEKRENGASSLLDALKDQSVSTIVIVGNYTIDHELDSYSQEPLQIARNVTITGQKGKDTVLNLSYKRSLVEVCSNITVTFDNITVTEERRGTGSMWDLFFGQPGSKIVGRDMYKLRLACTSEQHLAAVVSQTARSKNFPGSQQKFDFVDVTFQGHTYHQALKMIDYTADEPLTAQEGGPPYGGYALQEINKVRLCTNQVSQDCLTKFSPDYCVTSMIHTAELADAAATHGTGRQSVPVVAIAVAAAAVAGLLSAAAAAMLLWTRNRRLRQQQKQLGGWDEEDGTPGKSKQPKSTARTGDIQHGTFPKEGLDGDEEEVWEPMAIRRGWHMYHSMTTPLIAPVEDDVVHFGRLLGSGSFGRVYLAKWGGRQVAVKVIEHSGDTSKVVENEVKLMMTFNHPNIVRAFKFMNFMRSRKHGNSPTGAMGGTGVMSGSCSTSRVIDCHRSSAIGGIDATGGGNFEPEPHASSSGGAAAVAVGSELMKQASINCQDVLVAAPGTSSSSCGSRCSHTAAGAQQLGERQSPAATPALESSGASGAAGLPKLHGPIGSGSSCSSGALVPPVQSISAGSSERNCLQHGVGSFLARSSSPEAAAAAAAAGGGFAGTGHSSTTATAESNVQCTGGAATHSGSVVSDTLGYALKDEAVRAETWLITEYCDCGTLSGLAAKMQLPLDSDERLLQLLLLLRDAAMGLEVLHNSDVVHGDLNARNVLVSSSCVSPIGLVAKVADLGLSKTIKQHQTHRTTNTCGTMSHCPPELLHYGKMSAAGDIYAFAVMMWELYCNQPAFKTLHYGQFFDTVVRHNLRPTVPPGMPEDYQHLMEHCWATNPADRPKVAQVIETLDFMILFRQAQLSNAVLRCGSCVSAPMVLLADAGAVPAGPGSAAGGSAGGRPSSIQSSPLPALLSKPLPKRRTWDMHELHAAVGSAGVGAAAGTDAAAAAADADAADCDNDSSGEQMYIIPMSCESVPPLPTAAVDGTAAGTKAAAAAAPSCALLRSHTAEPYYTAVDIGDCYGIGSHLSEPIVSLQESHGRRNWFV